ncbi:MAG: hypothetical protein JW395_0081 [Nitrospira sp.]|nr:hypothetical protein [Nitrospira sp.]
MENSDDLAMETLLAVRAEIAPNLSESLLRKCYEIQVKNQFARDRSSSVQGMDRLIDDLVDAIASGADPEGASS